MVDFHLIMDLLPTLAKLFFVQKTLPADSVCLSYVQSAILIGMGLQYKKVEDLEGDLGLNAGQLLPQFNKLIRKFTKVIRMVYEEDIEKQMGEDKVIDLGNQEEIKEGLQEELENAEASGVVARQDKEKNAFLKKLQQHSKVGKVTKAEFD